MTVGIIFCHHVLVVSVVFMVTVELVEFSTILDFVSIPLLDFYVVVVNITSGALVDVCGFFLIYFSGVG